LILSLDVNLQFLRKTLQERLRTSALRAGHIRSPYGVQLPASFQPLETPTPSRACGKTRFVSVNPPAKLIVAAKLS
jgi:hypothetical protein